jgi:hypothetical protein
MTKEELLAAKNRYGLLGQLPGNFMVGGNSEGLTDPSTLPEWMRSQYERVSAGDGGGEYWRSIGHPRDQQGNEVMQVGNWADDVKDWSQVRNDPNLGYVSAPGNVHDSHYDKTPFKRALPFLAAFAAAVGGVGALAGSGGAGAGAAAAGEGAAGGGAAGAMDAATAAEWWGGAGAADAPSAGLFGSAGAGEAAGLGSAASGAGGGAGGSAGSSPGLLQQAGSWVANNPLRALSLANTARGLIGGGSNTGGSSASGGGQKSGGGQGMEPAKTQRPAWTPNPYLQAQLQRGGYL